ncbi:MAG: MBL fold metallo-hydrolase [Chloroflexota bacterium]|nr:MBL fold metallo-hydrolase [Chloroflexota bacterium]
MGIATAYLIESASGLVLVDAGLPHHEQSVLRRMQALGQDDLRLIFITHAHLDHYGSAAALRLFTGAPIAIHRADGDMMARGETHLGSVRGRGRLMWALLRLFGPYLRPEPTPPDLLLDDGDDLRAYGLDAVVLHTPGHTPGSSCLIVEGRVAFVGDLLSTSVRPHVQRSCADDWALIPESLNRLQVLGLEWVYAGHGRRPLSGKILQRMASNCQ